MMNALKWFAFTFVWWLFSLSVLLPFVFLLRLSKEFSNAWFSWLYTNVLAPQLGPLVTPFRVKCFEMLNEHLKNRNPKTPLRVLEIGIGQGGNLQYYPKNTKLISLDINPHFEKYFRKQHGKSSGVFLERHIIGRAEDMVQVDDDSVDVVVCTHVLCSVTDVRRVLGEVNRVLVPGGPFVFLEHVVYSPNTLSFFVQQFAAPLWKTFFAGCCINRNLGDNIRNAFSSVSYKNVEIPKMLLPVKHQIFGIAIK